MFYKFKCNKCGEEFKVIEGEAVNCTFCGSDGGTMITPPTRKVNEAPVKKVTKKKAK